MNILISQDDFDLTIGRLDRVLSKLVLWSEAGDCDEYNTQTLKHHAEDAILAGQKILKELDNRYAVKSKLKAKMEWPIGDEPKQKCNICNNPDCDIPNQKH